MKPTVRPLTAAALCGALTLTAACTADRDAGGPSPGVSDEPSSAAARQKPSILARGVNIGVKYDQPGFNVEDGDTRHHAGFENDLANFLGKEMKFEGMAFNDIPSKDREKVLREGTAELVIATYSITDDRDEEIDFAGPYFQTRQGLLVRDEDRSIDSREKTAGKVVCTVQGSTSDTRDSKPSTRKQLARLLPEAGVHLQEDYSDCVQQLRAGNVDAVWTDQAVLYGFVERHDDVRVVEGLEIGSPQLYGVGIQEGAEEDCRRVAEKLREFITSARWRESFRNHFPKLAAADEQFEQHYKPAVSDVDAYSCSDD